MRRLWSVLSGLLGRGSVTGSPGGRSGGFTGESTGEGVQSVSELLIGLSEFADIMSQSPVMDPATPPQKPSQPESSERRGLSLGPATPHQTSDQPESSNGWGLQLGLATPPETPNQPESSEGWGASLGLATPPQIPNQPESSEGLGLATPLLSSDQPESSEGRGLSLGLATPPQSPDHPEGQGLLLGLATPLQGPIQPEGRGLSLDLATPQNPNQPESSEGQGIPLGLATPPQNPDQPESSEVPSLALGKATPTQIPHQPESPEGRDLSLCLATPPQSPDQPENPEGRALMLLLPQEASKVVSPPTTLPTPPPLPAATLPPTESPTAQNVFRIASCRLQGLGAGPSEWAELTKGEGLRLYSSMRRIRHLGAWLQRQEGRSFLGQEACAVGVAAAILPSDHLITGSSAPLARFPRGAALQPILAQLTGNRGGVAREVGGAKFFYGGNGGVASQVSQGAGLALACRYQGTNQVVLTLYGDEAANQGQLFEVFNMASLWKLPVVFVCENLQSSFRSSFAHNHYSRGGPVPGVQVNGSDVLCVREATHFAVSHCRTNQGPIILELLTRRPIDSQRGGASPGEEEVLEEQQEERDPILLLKERLLRSNMAAEEEIQELDAEVQEEVQEALRCVSSDPAPPQAQEDFCHLLYCNSPKTEVRGVTAWSSTSS